MGWDEDTAVPCPVGRSRNNRNSIAFLLPFLGRETALPCPNFSIARGVSIRVVPDLREETAMPSPYRDCRETAMPYPNFCRVLISRSHVRYQFRLYRI
ncbi:MAG: hypothetical protein LH628_08480 [Microcoleus sp. CAN_BIN18]|nr:hypothetical protein [Microcoleus sp. CAN_BIN18]